MEDRQSKEDLEEELALLGELLDRALIALLVVVVAAVAASDGFGGGIEMDPLIALFLANVGEGANGQKIRESQRKGLQRNLDRAPPTAESQAFGRAATAARKAKGITQHALALTLGWGAHHVCDIERGAFRPDSPTAAEVRRVLGMEESWTSPES